MNVARMLNFQVLIFLGFENYEQIHFMTSIQFRERIIQSLKYFDPFGSYYREK